MGDKNNSKNSKPVNDSEKKFEHLLSSMSVPSGKAKEDAWEDLMLKINGQEGINKRRGFRIKRAVRVETFHLTKTMALVASFLVIATLGASLFWLTGIKTIEVARGESLTISLPDKTEVILNAESSISYKRVRWRKNRMVKLQGEAFFTVVKGPGFTVDFSSGLVTVVGTSFNVFNRDDKFEILCKTGTVLVRSDNNNISEKLESGEGIRKEIINDEKEIQRFDFYPDTELAWINGEFHFDQEPLGQVFQEIERQFNVIIESPYVDNTRRYSGIFMRGNLNDALDMVCIPMNLNYRTVEGEKVIIE